MDNEIDYKDLVIRFLNKDASESEIDVLKIWLEEDSNNRRFFNEVNELWQETGIKINYDYYKTETAWSEISKKLGQDNNLPKKLVIINKKNFRLLTVAASIACLVAMVMLLHWLVEKRNDNNILISSAIVLTNEGQKVEVYLPDSTHVFLNSSSVLKYNTNYNIKERVVELSGEAYFNVRGNPEKPFIVHSDHITVSATGTNFNISSYPNEPRIETTLEEGKIQFSYNDQESIDLKEGQQVIYFKKTNEMLTRDVNAEIYTSWKENKLRLIDTPIEEALRRIARRYNVSFEIRSYDLLDLKYTATFIDESIEEVMQMLKAVSPITYTIYKRTGISDIQYLKPKIIIDKKGSKIIYRDY